MIFNWYKNSEKILMTGEYTHDDYWDIQHTRTQQIFFIKYLLMIGKTKQEAFEIWKNIRGGVIEMMHEESINVLMEFSALHTRSVKKKDELLLPASPVPIYQSEIDYLNSLKAPLWVRQYWFGVLVWHKHVNQKYKRVKFNYYIGGWLLKQIIPGAEIRYKNRELAKWNDACNKPIRSEIVGVADYQNIPWLKKKGTIIATIESPEDFMKYEYLLKRGTCICSKCGKEYDISAKTQRDTCKECWKAKERLRLQKYREKMKSYKQ